MKKITLIAMMALMTGCSLMPKKAPPPDKIVVLPTYGEMVSIPKATPTQLKKIEFKIKKVEVASLEKPNTTETIVLYSLDEMNMQVLAGNLDELHRYIREQKAVIDYTTGLINLRREQKEPTK